MHIGEMLNAIASPLAAVDNAGDPVLVELQKAFAFVNTEWDEQYDVTALSTAIDEAEWLEDSVRFAFVKLSEGSKWEARVHLAAAIVQRAYNADTAYL